MRRVIVVLSAFVIGVLGVAVLSGPANAETGWISPGSTVCTDRTQSSGGVTIYGIGNNQPSLWTVFAASAVNGPETVVFRRSTGSIENYPTVTHPDPGTYFYRFCVRNPRTDGFRQVVKLRMYGNGPIGQAGIGPHHAVLTQNSMFCGEFSRGAARFVAQSDVPVRFWLQGFDADYSSRHIVFDVTGTAVDQVVALPAELHSMEACVSTPASATSTATVSFDLVGA
ncbi:hypothetical protein GCM10009850_120400 [Nonomuraea monospora]|uniref:Secreted protein n=1 Tax=Nonomuraea monospora TaxID=568818 RepID=A0ABN3D3Z7_9ACTN